jgi:hypothetical protein
VTYPEVTEPVTGGAADAGRGVVESSMPIAFRGTVTW